jgi:hypothetical protein
VPLLPRCGALRVAAAVSQGMGGEPLRDGSTGTPVGVAGRGAEGLGVAGAYA